MGDASISAAQANLQQAQAVGQLSDVLAAKKGLRMRPVAAAEKTHKRRKINWLYRNKERLLLARR